MHAPYVSVIVPFWNAERFIDEAIRSVLNQAYQNWELLLIDDGSDDAGTKIARNYAARFNRRLIYLEHESHTNEGTSATRNVGIKHARGELISFLDADDVWLPTHLQQQLAVMASHPEVGMAYGMAEWWYSWSDASAHERDHVPELKVTSDRTFAPLDLVRAALTRGLEMPPPTSVVVRKSAADQVGGFEESFRGMYDDQAFYLKIFAHFPVYVSNECWGRYRQHAESLYAKATAMNNKTTARGLYLRWAQAYLANQGAMTASLQAVLESELAKLRPPSLLRRVATRVRQARPGLSPFEWFSRTLRRS
jgi:glycosyltransferase involved in cell wall biosynthesis